MDKKILFIKNKMWLGLFLAVMVNCFAYYFPRLLNQNRYHANLSWRLDDTVPFISWTVLIYLGCYLFWIVNYILACTQEEEEAYRFLSADLLAKVICLILFIVIPTTNTRPVVDGTSIYDYLVRLLYSIDQPDNLFPSIHCMVSWFSFIAVRKNKRIGFWYKSFSFCMVLLICISTLTTKQHVVIDVFGGVCMAELSYQFTKCITFDMIYRRALEWLRKRGKASGSL